METRTVFDLSTAVERWRGELAMQHHLTPDILRELEHHLHDAIAEFQKAGLTDEESFWIARRRIGHPQQLDEEFEKADPIAVWKNRGLWMVTGLMVVNYWQSLLYAIPTPRLLSGSEPGIHAILIQYGIGLVYQLPCLGIALLLAKKAFRKTPFTKASSRHFKPKFAAYLTTFSIALIAGQAWRAFPEIRALRRQPVSWFEDPYLANILSQLTWHMALILLAVWLIRRPSGESAKAS